MTSTTYQVTGMTCEHCTRAVTDEISVLDGVSAVTVDLVPGGRSAVTVTSAPPLSAESLAAALDEAGDYRLADGDDRLADRDARLADGDAPAPVRTLPLV
jgi:copper chaperone